MSHRRHSTARCAVVVPRCSRIPVRVPKAVVTNSSRNLPPALTADGFSAQSDGTRISFEAPAQPVGSAMIGGVPFTLWPDCGLQRRMDELHIRLVERRPDRPAIQVDTPAARSPRRAQPHAVRAEIPRPHDVGKVQHTRCRTNRTAVDRLAPNPAHVQPHMRTARYQNRLSLLPDASSPSRPRRRSSRATEMT